MKQKIFALRYSVPIPVSISIISFFLTVEGHTNKIKFKWAVLNKNSFSKLKKK